MQPSEYCRTGCRVKQVGGVKTAIMVTSWQITRWPRLVLRFSPQHGGMAIYEWCLLGGLDGIIQNPSWLIPASLMYRLAAGSYKWALVQSKRTDTSFDLFVVS